METDESIFYATPQIKGKIVHETIDYKKASTSANDILSLPVYSEKYSLMGKIDVYKKKEKKLIERKNHLTQIFQGQIYQLWAQMFCMEEMGYEVDSLAFYDISKNKMMPVDKPNEDDTKQFELFVDKFKKFDPENSLFTINNNKCRHCIYCNICEKTIEDNVYT